jgi:hypothetical protein
MQYDVSPYANAIPSWPYQIPLSGQFSGYPSASPLQSRAGSYTGSQQGYGENPLGGFAQSEFPNPLAQGMQPHLSPEHFAGSLGRQQQFNLPLSPVETLFITELARCGRGLQEVAEQFESKEPEAQRRGIYAATAHLFYAFGLLSSKGIFITAELPMGRGRLESLSVPNACREFGKQLDRFIDKYANGRNLSDELTNLVERGKMCYIEIAKSIDTSDIFMSDPQSRKKAA